jgi:hypothetical protein
LARMLLRCLNEPIRYNCSDCCCTCCRLAPSFDVGHGNFRQLQLLSTASQLLQARCSPVQLEVAARWNLWQLLLVRSTWRSLGAI